MPDMTAEERDTKWWNACYDNPEHGRTPNDRDIPCQICRLAMVREAEEAAERRTLEWCCGWVPRDRAEDLRKRFAERSRDGHILP